MLTAFDALPKRKQSPATHGPELVVGQLPARHLMPILLAISFRGRSCFLHCRFIRLKNGKWRPRKERRKLAVSRGSSTRKIPLSVDWCVWPIKIPKPNAWMAMENICINLTRIRLSMWQLLAGTQKSEKRQAFVIHIYHWMVITKKTLLKFFIPIFMFTWLLA